MKTVGLLGGGQLGRFLGLEAKKLGLRAVVLDPTPDGPAAQVCDEHIQAPIDDQVAALELARRSDVVTFEWEMIPAALLERVAKEKPVRPGASVLRVIQDRLIQKEFIKEKGLPQAEYLRVDGFPTLEDAARRLRFPTILKRRRHGYDGKGQLRLNDAADLRRAESLLDQPCVLEKKIAFAKEISVILARGLDGGLAVYPIAENIHRDGILHTTLAPARLAPETAREAEKIAARLAAALNHVGVLAVEMFLLEDGTLLVNEIAPRVHNSGHFTLDACSTSQFEQHVRAICGFSLGPVNQACPAVMVNLLGDLWSGGEPRWERVMRRPDLRLHLYGKAKPAPGRKMGHIVALGDAEKALAEADSLLDSLKR